MGNCECISTPSKHKLYNAIQKDNVSKDQKTKHEVKPLTNDVESKNVALSDCGYTQVTQVEMKTIDDEQKSDAPPKFQQLIKTLKMYRNYKNDLNVSNVSDYFERNKQYIINDYQNILDVQEFKYLYHQLKQNDLLCDIKTCKFYLRNNRQRSRENVFDEKINDIKLSMYLDILDCIHCYCVHSVDTGYVIVDTISPNIVDNTHDDRKHNNICYDEQMANLKSFVNIKRKRLQEINTQNRFETNKFMSQIYVNNENKDEINNTQLAQEEESADKYSFGVRYDYWDKHPNKYDHKNTIPKYSNLKEELLTNKIQSIHSSAFDQSYEKANALLLYSNAIKAMKNSITDYYYGIKKGISINVYNVLCIIFYCDYDALSFNLSKTFRKIDVNETDQQITNRNKEYANWAKILIETVNCFGTQMKDASFDVLYHGMSFMYFDHFIAQFDSPTSTTTSLAVATIFATNDGIILELTKHDNNYGDWLRYFNCAIISNFANENEKLFIQPPNPNSFCLKFASIRNISTDENYKELMDALTILEQIMHHQQFDHIQTTKTSHAVGIHSLKRAQSRSSKLFTSTILRSPAIKILNNLFRLSTSSSNDVPTYVLNTFKKWTNKQNEISVSLNKLTKYEEFDIVTDNLIKVDKMNMIFRNIESITCYCYEIHEVDVDFFLTLIPMIKQINTLQFSKLTKINISGVKMSPSYHISVHQEMMRDIGWNIELKNQFGSDNLYISKCNNHAI